MNVQKTFETGTVHLLTNGTSLHQKHRHVETSWCYNTKSDFKLVLIFLIWLTLYCSMCICLFVYLFAWMGEQSHPCGQVPHCESTWGSRGIDPDIVDGSW